MSTLRLFHLNEEHYLIVLRWEEITCGIACKVEKQFVTLVSVWLETDQNNALGVCVEELMYQRMKEALNINMHM